MSHQLETIIGYKFKHPELLETTLTHTSYANETRPPVKHNERLEFLGDSVLQIVSADYLFHAYADRPEGLDQCKLCYHMLCAHDASYASFMLYVHDASYANHCKSL